MDPLRLCLAIGPVALYLIALGARNLRRRPTLVTGGRDFIGLAAAVSGMVIVGPMELFFPHMAAARYGAWTWLMLFSLYGLLVVLVVLVQRPRLVIYNISVEQLRPTLADVVERLDADVRWAGDSLALPNLGIQLHIDPFPAMRNVSLVASGGLQSHVGWRKLEWALREAIRGLHGSWNPRGLSLAGTGLLALVMLTATVAQRRHEMLEQLSAAADEVSRIWKGP